MERVHSTTMPPVGVSTVHHVTIQSSATGAKQECVRRPSMCHVRFGVNVYGTCAAFGPTDVSRAPLLFSLLHCGAVTLIMSVQNPPLNIFGASPRHFSQPPPSSLLDFISLGHIFSECPKSEPTLTMFYRPWVHLQWIHLVFRKEHTCPFKRKKKKI